MYLGVGSNVCAKVRLASTNITYVSFSFPMILLLSPGTPRIASALLYLKNKKNKNLTGQKRWGAVRPERVAAGCKGIFPWFTKKFNCPWKLGIRVSHQYHARTGPVACIFAVHCSGKGSGRGRMTLLVQWGG